MPDTERLAASFAALGNVQRLQLIKDIAAAPFGVGGADIGRTITSLAQSSEVSRFAASHHLAVLREAGLVRAHRDRTSLRHHLNGDAFLEIDDWLFPLIFNQES